VMQRARALLQSPDVAVCETHAQAVLRLTAAELNITVERLVSEPTDRRAAAARRAAIWVLQRHLGLSYRQIRQQFKGRTDSGVYNALRAIDRAIAEGGGDHRSAIARDDVDAIVAAAETALARKRARDKAT